MQKANPKKKNKQKHVQRSGTDLVAMANFLHFAIDVRTKLTVEGCTHDEMRDWMRSKVILLQEVQDKRSSVWDIVNDTKEMTGFDTMAELSTICEELFGEFI